MEYEIKILFTGDFFACNRSEELIIKELYSDIFNDFLPIIHNSDIAVTNLESPLTEEQEARQKTGPAIKASPKSMDALKYAGFNLLTLANNHIMDYGPQGLRNTVDLCKKNNIDFCGVGTNLESASKVYYKIVKETTLAFINIAENEFSTTNGEEPGANPLNPISNFYAIQEARRNADFVFVIVHGGHEMYQFPSPRMKQAYRFFVDVGADAVIGHHPHCYSGWERYKGGYIFYSLGNLLFDKIDFRNSVWNYGFAVRFIINCKKLYYEIFPYEQSNTIPGIHLLSKERERDFNSNLEFLNRIILNDQILSNEFNLFVSRTSPTYEGFLEPFSNKYFLVLKKRRIIPSFLGKRKRLLYLNLIRCESHRDLIIKILQK